VTVFFVGQLAHATDGFSDAQRIGGGGFGSVYKAVLLTVGATRKPAATDQGFSSDQGIHHEHAGVCLVLPLIKHGSLEERLFLDPSACRRLGRLSDMTGVAGAPAGIHEPLTGTQRLSVLFGAVKGLEYLHTPDPAIFKPVIMHRDIKSRATSFSTPTCTLVLQVRESVITMLPESTRH